MYGKAFARPEFDKNILAFKSSDRVSTRVEAFFLCAGSVKKKAALNELFPARVTLFKVFTV
jgi:hypothetical protein